MSTAGHERGQYQYQPESLPLINKLARDYQDRRTPEKGEQTAARNGQLWEECHLTLKALLRFQEQRDEARTQLASLQDDQEDQIQGPLLEENLTKGKEWAAHLAKSLDEHEPRAGRLYRQWWTFAEPWFEARIKNSLEWIEYGKKWAKIAREKEAINTSLQQQLDARIQEFEANQAEFISKFTIIEAERNSAVDRLTRADAQHILDLSFVHGKLDDEVIRVRRCKEEGAEKERQVRDLQQRLAEADKKDLVIDDLNRQIDQLILQQSHSLEDQLEYLDQKRLDEFPVPLPKLTLSSSEEDEEDEEE